MMRALMFLVIVALYGSDNVNAKNNTRPSTVGCGSRDNEVEHVVKVVCTKSRSYRLLYVRARREIILVTADKSVVLHTISKGRDPELVGTDAIIGFLPDKLQAYKRENILVYLSSIRTNSGGFGGQCGSGAEIYLNFLDVRTARPTIRSRLLVGSCNEPIELVDQDMTRGKFGDITVVGGALSLDFLFYKDEKGDTNGTVSPDFKRFLFK